MPVVTEKVTRRAFVGTGAMALGAATVGRPVWAAPGRADAAATGSTTSSW